MHERFIQSFKSDPANASRDFFYSLAQAQFNKPDIKFFGDSTPVNMMHSRQIKELLPDARFINVIRDGRDVALSITKERWGPNEPYAGLKWWANRVLKSAEALAKVDQKSVLEFRIEDLIVHERDVAYKNILNFLEVKEMSGLLVRKIDEQYEFRPVIEEVDNGYNLTLKKNEVLLLLQLTHPHLLPENLRLKSSENTSPIKGT